MPRCWGLPEALLQSAQWRREVWWRGRAAVQRHHSSSSTYCGAGVARSAPPSDGSPSSCASLASPSSSQASTILKVLGAGKRRKTGRTNGERGAWPLPGLELGEAGVAAFSRDPRPQSRLGAPSNSSLTLSPAAPWVGASDTWSRRLGGGRQRKRAVRQESPDPEFGELGSQTARAPELRTVGGEGRRGSFGERLGVSARALRRCLSE